MLSVLIATALTLTTAPIVDEGWIAFRSNRAGAADIEIWTMQADGSDIKQLTNGSGRSNSPAISPDGTRIAFTYTRDGNSYLRVANSDGSNTIESDQYNLTYPSWHPNSIYLLATYRKDGERDGEIRMITVNPNIARRPFNLTEEPLTTASSYEAVYHPNGDKFCIVVSSSGSERRRLKSLAVGSGEPGFFTRIRDITPAAWNATNLAASPKGDLIAYASNRDGSMQIYVTDWEGEDHRRITDGTGQNRQPCFSPDGTKIAYSRRAESGNWDIWVINVDGSNAVNITDDPADDREPSWGPTPEP